MSYLQKLRNKKNNENMQSIDIRLTDYRECAFGRLTVTENEKTLLETYVLTKSYRNNKPFKSRIPDGVYNAQLREPSKHISVKHIEILDVPGRYAILIHPFNNASESKGCFAPGLTFSRENEFSVWRSKAAMKKIVSLLSTEFTVRVFS